MSEPAIYNKPHVDLSEVADASVSVVVTSPPYNLSHGHQVHRKFNLNGYGDFKDRLPEGQYQHQQIELLQSLSRVLTNDGSVFYVHKDRRIKGRTLSPMEWIARASGLALYQTIIWNRRSSHNVDPIRLPPTTEYVYWLTKPSVIPRFSKECREWGLVWDISPHAETRRIPHPAPFPLAIPLRCIMLAGAVPSELVLDPYLGSGTTAVASSILGIPFVGYEINADYIQLARDRIAAAKVRWLRPEKPSLPPLRPTG